MMVDEENRELAIDRAESLVRRLRTGAITGFVLVATGDDDDCFVMMGGHVTLTQTICLLEHQRLVLLGEWMERFDDDDGAAALGSVEDEE
jgi:hypothetical protein